MFDDPKRQHQVVVCYFFILDIKHFFEEKIKGSREEGFILRDVENKILKNFAGIRTLIHGSRSEISTIA